MQINGQGFVFNGPQKVLHNRVMSKFHAAVAIAVRSGRLVKPDVCEVCDENPNRLEAHHADYNDQYILDVIWLCRGCHKMTHRYCEVVYSDAVMAL